MEMITRFLEIFHVPNLLLAVAVLILGVVIAKVISKLVRQLLLTGDFDLRLARWLNIEAFMGDLQAPRKRLATIIELFVFYFLLVVVLIFFLQLLGDQTINQTLGEFLTQIVESLPAFLKAVLILVVAWVIAIVVKFIVIRLLKGLGWGEKLSKALEPAEEDEEEKRPRKKDFAESLGNAAFYLIMLFAVPAFLEALGVDALVAPFQVMFNKVFEFIPNILAASVFFTLGYFLARICERLVANFLLALGINRWLESMRLETVVKTLDVAKVLGTLVFVGIMIPVLSVTFRTLQLPMLSEVFTNMMTQVTSSLPLIFGAFVLVVIGLIIGRFLGDLSAQVLQNLGFDAILGHLGLSESKGEEEEEGAFRLSKIAGNVIYAVIVLLLVMEGFKLMQFEGIARLIENLLMYLPDALIACIIIGFGLYIARIVEQLVRKGFSADREVEANIVGLLLRYTVIGTAFFMAFEQLKVAESIVTNAFIILLGTIGLAAALAFGLGARDQASEYVKALLERTKKSKK